MNEHQIPGRGRTAALLFTVLAVAGCGSSAGRPTPAVSPSATPSPPPAAATASPVESTPEASPALTQSPGPPLPGTRTGVIQGLAQRGPTCPVERLGGPPCVAPVVVRVVVSDQRGRQLAATTSAADGSFRFVLPPGLYTVSGSLPRPMGASVRSVTVRVVAGGVAQVTLSFDTGIR